jgi:hypothetical protein
LTSPCRKYHGSTHDLPSSRSSSQFNSHAATFLLFRIRSYLLRPTTSPTTPLWPRLNNPQVFALQLYLMHVTDYLHPLQLRDEKSLSELTQVSGRSYNPCSAQQILPNSHLHRKFSREKLAMPLALPPTSAFTLDRSGTGIRPRISSWKCSSRSAPCHRLMDPGEWRVAQKLDQIKAIWDTRVIFI